MTTGDDVSRLIYVALDELKGDYDQAPDTPWENRRACFVQTLESRGIANHAVMERLLDRLDDSSENDRTSMLTSGQLNSEADELISQYTASHDQGLAQEAASAYDVDAWYGYLRESCWRWDGSEPAWGPFREWIVYDAGQRGFGMPTKALMDELTADAAAQRVAKLAQYGVTIGAAAQQGTSQTAPAPAYDVDAWYGYLRESCWRWDGSEPAWGPFREWIVYDAG
ncbi:MAG TPA: hypothetical protein VNV62_21565, partial [Trebonia sp.]|nr:hypothetical protein [Trebonia sp.]